ncbi:MAG: pyridoxal phosphate biosynthetic protein [Betaproteobacteria bacterium]|nr:pyridoxal phosphate biosynthetic protein [Betaproteobacteria bacterium]
MTRLSVNLNKVALLRNARALGIPSVTRAASIALDAGAHGITVHPRPDERHIRIADVHDLAALLKQHPGVEYNIEGNPFENALDLVREVRPHQFTLVPDDPGQSTSDHGWDLARDGERLGPLIEEVKALGVRVSLFMDPLPEAILRAADIGADRIELYTEPYAAHFGSKREDEVLAQYTAAARAAQSAGLGINAGHDLNRVNLPRFIGEVPGVLEVSIGHALIADALELGLAATVREYLAAIGQRA